MMPGDNQRLREVVMMQSSGWLKQGERTDIKSQKIVREARFNGEFLQEIL